MSKVFRIFVEKKKETTLKQVKPLRICVTMSA